MPILPAGLQGYVASQEQNRAQGDSNLRQLLGIMNVQNQLAQQAQEAQTNPLRVGILRGQLDKMTLENELQRKFMNSVGQGPLTPDVIEQLGVVKGSPGMIETARHLRDSELHRQAIGQLQAMTTPDAPSPAGTVLASGPNQELERTSTVPGVSGVLPPSSSGRPSDEDLQRMIEMDKAGVPINFKQATPLNMAAALAQAKVPATIAERFLPPTPVQQARIDIAANAVPKVSPNYQWNRDRTAVEPIPGSPADPNSNKGALTPEALGTAGWEKLLFGKDPPGMGAASAAQKAQVMNERTRLGKSLGLTDFEMAMLPQDNKVKMKAVDTLTKWGATVGRSAEKLDLDFNVALDYAKKMPLSTIQTVNRGVVSGMQEFNNPDANAYAAALNTVRQEYARLMSGPTSNAMLPVEAMKKGNELLSSGINVPALEEVRKQMLRDAQNTLMATNGMINGLRGSIQELGRGAFVGSPQSSPPSGQPGEQDLGSQVRSLGVPYEPDKYEYRVLNGKVQRKAK